MKQLKHILSCIPNFNNYIMIYDDKKNIILPTHKLVMYLYIIDQNNRKRQINNGLRG